jgi:hypothetical protein
MRDIEPGVGRDRRLWMAKRSFRHRSPSPDGRIFEIARASPLAADLRSKRASHTEARLPCFILDTSNMVRCSTYNATSLRRSPLIKAGRRRTFRDSHGNPRLDGNPVSAYRVRPLEEDSNGKDTDFHIGSDFLLSSARRCRVDSVTCAFATVGTRFAEGSVDRRHQPSFTITPDP